VIRLWAVMVPVNGCDKTARCSVLVTCFHKMICCAVVGDEGYARPSSAAPSSMRASSEQPVPEEVFDRARQHSGQEGGEGGRPGSAMPSSLRGVAATGGTWEPPVPVEVLQRAKQHSGQEGEAGGRPGSAVPSSLRAAAAGEVPVPEHVQQYASHFAGKKSKTF
jgi:hypothetical protein